MLLGNMLLSKLCMKWRSHFSTDICNSLKQPRKYIHVSLICLQKIQASWFRYYCLYRSNVYLLVWKFNKLSEYYPIISEHLCSWTENGFIVNWFNCLIIIYQHNEIHRLHFPTCPTSNHFSGQEFYWNHRTSIIIFIFEFVCLLLKRFGCTQWI